MAENNGLEDIAQYADPSRRKFLFGLISTAIAAPTVISFVSGAIGGASASNALPMGGLFIDNSGNYNYDPSANWLADPSANYLCILTGNYTLNTGNYFSNSSANYWLDIYTDTSGNSVYFDYSSNTMYDVNGSWMCDPSMNFLYDPSGNWTPLTQTSNQQPNNPTPTNAPAATTTTAPAQAGTVTPTTTTVPKALPETR